MIREIINFTNYLNNDLKDLIESRICPKQEGVFVVIDKDGSFKTEYYFEGDSSTSFIKDCALKLMNSWTIEYDRKPYYQKCFDLPNKRIHSVSPFVVALKRQYLEGGKEANEKKVDVSYVEIYLKKTISETVTDDCIKQAAECFLNILKKKFDVIVQRITSECSKINDNQYVIFFFNVPLSYYEATYNNYLKLKLFNSSKKGLTDNKGRRLSEEEARNLVELRGWSNFYCTYNDDKFFLKHRTGLTLVNTISNVDAKLLNDFKEYIRMGLLPQVMPIFIDNDELINGGAQSEFIRIYNDGNKLHFRDVIDKIFEKREQTLQKYYLLYMQNGSIMDYDFVPNFTYKVSIDVINLLGVKKNGSVECNQKIKTIFELEELLSNLFLKYNEKSKQGYGFLKNNYFNSAMDFKDLENRIIGKGYKVYGQTWNLFLKYRKAIYDYIYKSKSQSLTLEIFEDIVYSAIYAEIQMDEGLAKRSDICKKLNIWFSLYDYFENNKNKKNMTSKVKELKDKIRTIACGESDIESPEEFAFAAGQLVSYLLDRSAASDKDYSMLEPYLQKAKSGQLQDAIAHTITIYKHDIKVYKGKFENLASNVLADGSNVEMKPLLKFFLAGCFSTCVIYEKKETNE